MNQLKKINFGFRGWMLIIYQASAFFAFVAFTNYPQNILADMYGGSEVLSKIYTSGTLLAIVFQLIMSRYIGKMKNIMRASVISGIIDLAFCLAIMLIPAEYGSLWRVCFFGVSFMTPLYSFFFVGVVVGQWFPRRKGTVMGIATLSFPIGCGMIGVFASRVYASGAPDVFNAYLPFFIICVVGLLIGVIFVRDYPEQVGAYRDNDASFTPEQANAIMLEEIENKRSSVWTLTNTVKSRDFWLSTLPIGFLLLCSTGMVTYTSTFIGVFPELNLTTVMFVYMCFGCLGSWLLGVLDTRFGTKKAITIACAVMLVSGVCGALKNSYAMVAALMLLATFQGAASNFTVSVAAQYWRREDFAKVFSANNPIASILQCTGVSLVVMLGGGDLAANYANAFVFTAIIGVLGIILISLFSPANVKHTDDKYRHSAGKTLDNALGERL